MTKKHWIPILSALVALVFLLSPLAPAQVQNYSGQPLGQIFHQSGNPWAHSFSDVQDIRGATVVVAASDSKNKYDADYTCDGVDDHLTIQAAIDSLLDYVEDEEFNSSDLDSWVELDNEWIQHWSEANPLVYYFEVVTSLDGNTTYSGTYRLGDDYAMDYAEGKIKCLSTGDMSANTSYEIDYYYGKGEVSLLDGRYITRGQIFGVCFFTLSGQGRGTIIKLDPDFVINSTSIPAGRLRMVYMRDVEGVTVKDLTIDGSGNEASGCPHCANLWLEAQDSTVSNCWIVDPYYHGIVTDYGDIPKHAENIVIEGCHIILNVDAEAAFWGYGIRMAHSDHIVISNNCVNGSFGIGIGANNGPMEGLIVSNNVITSCELVSIELADSTTRSVISGNTVDHDIIYTGVDGIVSGNCAANIYIRTDNISVVGNHLSGVLDGTEGEHLIFSNNVIGGNIELALGGKTISHSSVMGNTVNGSILLGTGGTLTHSSVIGNIVGGSIVEGSNADYNIIKNNYCLDGVTLIGEHSIAYEWHADLFMDCCAATTTYVHSAITGVGDELLVNGDMELDSNWTVIPMWGNPTTNERSNEQAHGGTYSRKIVGPDESNFDGEEQEFTTTISHMYDISGWLYVTEGEARIGAAWQATLFVYSPNDYVQSSTADEASWNKVTVRYTATNISAYAEYHSGWDAGTLYVDDMSAKECVVVTTDITNPDVPRTVSITTTNVSSPYGDVTIEGKGTGGSNISEDISIVAGGTAYSNNAFSTVTRIIIPGGVSSSDTVSVGISDKLGILPVIYNSEDVYKMKKNNADVSIGTINMTYRTIDCATINANDDFTVYYRSNLNIVS